ncbi:MAG: hypothetical protein GY714_16515, partial [Desulfobacterales bacterium]|nr:hypothetical protein [Desulfobacterales bacterium]
FQIVLIAIVFFFACNSSSENNNSDGKDTISNNIIKNDNTIVEDNEISDNNVEVLNEENETGTNKVEGTITIAEQSFVNIVDETGTEHSFSLYEMVVNYEDFQEGRKIEISYSITETKILIGYGAIDADDLSITLIREASLLNGSVSSK